MRLATVASIAVLAVSSAALAQVAGTPVEQKTYPANEAAPSAKDSDGLDNGAMASPTNVTAANGTTPAPEKTPAPRPR